MARSIVHLLAALGVAAIAPAVHAAIVNPSFEDVDANYQITGWNVPGDPDGNWLPWAWSNLWGQPPNPGSGELCAAMDFGGGGGQLVTLNAGDVVLFDAGAITPRGPYFADDYRLQVWLIDPSLSWPIDGAPWDPNTPTRWNMYWPSDTPLLGQWLTGSLTAPATGTYRLGFWGSAGINVGNQGMFVMIDNFRVVPAPGAASLLGLGILLAACRRR